MQYLFGGTLFLLYAISGTASAQTWTADQQEIWKTEQAMWVMDTAHDLKWIDTSVHPDSTSWGIDTPVPRSKASIMRWDKYDYGNYKVLEYELFPLAITVVGDVAVVHYRYQVATENYKNERATVTGRYSDVLVKSGSRWLLLAAIGGDDRKSAQ